MLPNVLSSESMSRLKRRWVWWGVALGLAAGVAVGGFWLVRDMPVRYVDQLAADPGPIECRLVINDWRDRLAGAYHDLPPGRLRDGRVPAFRNPLVMRGLLARVEVRNRSDEDLAVFSQVEDLSAGVRPDTLGEVKEFTEDETGRRVEIDPSSISMEQIGRFDKATGEWVSNATLTALQRPILRLAPGQVVTYRFHP